jgi:hypothetical protein
MTTYGDIRGKVLRVLGDPTGAVYSTDLVYDGVIAAHRAILPWVPKFSEYTYTSSGSSSFALPSDVYRMEAVKDVGRGMFLPKIQMSPNIVNANLKNNTWIEYPSGFLSFSDIVESGAQITIYYQSYWIEPSSGSASTIEVPLQSHTGLIYYACSHILLQKAVNSASLRQYNTKVDSGVPEDNPLKTMMEVFLNRFYQEMKLMPQFTRATQ